MERDPTKFQAISGDFIITQPTIQKSDADLWNILGRPLEKARKYVTSDEAAKLTERGVKIEQGKKGGLYYDAKAQRTSLAKQPEKVRAAVKDLYAEGMDAKLIAGELEEKHGIKVHPETINRFLEREGVETFRPTRETVSRADMEQRDQILDETREAIKEFGAEMDRIKDENAAQKERIEKMATAQSQSTRQAYFMLAKLRGFTMMGQAPTEKEYDAICAEFKEFEAEKPEKEPEKEREREPPERESGERTAEEKKAKIEKTITDYEMNIREQSFESCGVVNEDGDMIFTKDGKKSFIVFTPEELKKLKGTTFTHNHPMGHSFSKADIRMACFSETKEIRAVSPHGKTYSMTLKSGENFTQELWDEKINERCSAEDTNVRGVYEVAINEGNMTIDDANNKHWNEVWERVARAVPEIEYREITNE